MQRRYIGSGYSNINILITVVTLYAINKVVLISYLVEINIVLIAFSVLTCLTGIALRQANGLENLNKPIRLVIPTSLIGSFYIHLIVVYLYIFNFKWGSTFGVNQEVELPLHLLNLQGGSISLDLFGLVMITLSYLVGFISLTSINDKTTWSGTKQPIIFNFFILVVLLFVTCDHLFTFFLYYEFLLLPSFLIVYFTSSNKKGIQASFYFLVWTQAGSTLVLAVVIYLMKINNINYFNQLLTLGNYTNYIEKLKLVLFLGFGFKIPIWPLYYWLTKTHVEATGAFSMYLSGFLVKTALYGLYKFLITLDWSSTNSIFFLIATLGVVISSLQMWSQVDLKKVVALCTVQEMNLLMICFMFGQSPLVYAGILFCFMHALLSTLMFFLVDLLQKRFGTRLSTELTGVIHICPNLGLTIISMCLCFLALPFTLKFSCEFMLFSGIADISTIILFLTCLITNWIAPIAFCKLWYSVLFGTPSKKYHKVMDMDFKEISISLVCIVMLVVPGATLVSIM